MFEAWSLREADVEARDEALREAVRALDDEHRARYFRSYQAKLKDPDTYATLNWVFVAGLHHFYLGKVARGLLNIGLMLLGLLLLFTLMPLGLIVLGVLFLAELPALFRSQVVVADHNVREGERILHSLR